MRKKLRSLVSVGYIILFLISILIIYNFSSVVYAQDESALVVEPLDGWTVDTGQLFSVRVTLGTGDSAQPVAGAYVFVQSYGTSKTTDESGIVWLNAPSDQWKFDSFTVIANKSGFSDGKATLGLNKKAGLFESITQSPYFFVFIASILIICIVVYVYFRQKRSIYARAKEITDDRTLERYSANVKVVSPGVEEEKPKPEYYAKEVVRSKQVEDPKVEEIRISRPYKEKEKIIPVKVSDEKIEAKVDRKLRQIDEKNWFEGTDEIKYEVDKLTGEIDEDGIDKWFEGVDELKEKINKKMKKKTKNTD